MKVLLVVPPSSIKERWGKFSTAVQTYLPLGLAYIAAYVEKDGHDVRVVDAVASRNSFEDMEKIIRDFTPDVVGQQSVFSNLEECYRVARIVKEINPGTVNVLGGAHTSMYSDASINRDEIDYIVCGEGELVMQGLLRSLSSGSDMSEVPGLVWKDGSKVIKNKNQPFIEDLDSIPMPAWHLFPMDKYHATSQLKGSRTLSMVASRGCPFRCAYCWVPSSFGKSLRYHSPRRVVDEMLSLKEKYGADSIRFWDDSFTANKKWINEFCDILIAENVGLPWSCLTRVNLVNPELLAKLKAAGCYQIYYGIESGVQRVLDIIRKGTTLDQARSALKMTREAGLESFCSYMLALPGESKEDAYQTIAFSKELDSDYVQFNLTIPHISGDDFYNLAREHGTVLEDEVGHATLFDNPTYIPHGRTTEELKDTIKLAYRSYYTRPSYIINRLYKLRGLSPRKYFILIWTGIKVFFWR